MMPFLIAACFSWIRYLSCSSGVALDAHVIVDGDDAGKMISDLVHVHLEDVLAHLQAKGNAQEKIPPFVGIKDCKV